MRDFGVIGVFFLAILAFSMPPVIGQSGASREGIPRIWSVHDLPNPHSPFQHNHVRCGRLNMSSVCDPNSIISRADADAIDSLIDGVYRDTKCPCYVCQNITHTGYVIRVAIMPNMEKVNPSGENTTLGMLTDAQLYSYILTKRWEMEGFCNETLLILYSKYDQILYTLTRPNTKLKLSNEDVKEISLLVRYYFDQDDTIADGIREMIRRYRLIFEGRRQEAFAVTT